VDFGNGSRSYALVNVGLFIGGLAASPNSKASPGPLMIQTRGELNDIDNEGWKPNWLRCFSA